jgi:ABC-2 type transport system permease protein
MIALFKKEVIQFFSSITGYLSIILFLTANGLFLFIFPETNIFGDRYATLATLFRLAPWIFLLLIPAVTMRLFSDEWRGGTMELLLTRPLSEWQIIFGKYLSAVFLLLFALIPTVIYYITVRSLAVMPSDVDSGAILGSYIGLFLLGSVFTAIGVWSSSLSGNTVVTFLLAVFFCFIFYTGFEALSNIPAFAGNLDYYLELIGIQYHYQSISRGVVDVRDVIYFLSVNALFLYLTKLSLDKRKWE